MWELSHWKILSVSFLSQDQPEFTGSAVDQDPAEQTIRLQHLYTFSLQLLILNVCFCHYCRKLMQSYTVCSLQFCWLIRVHWGYQGDQGIQARKEIQGNLGCRYVHRNKLTNSKKKFKLQPISLLNKTAMVNINEWLDKLWFIYLFLSFVAGYWWKERRQRRAGMFVSTIPLIDECVYCFSWLTAFWSFFCVSHHVTSSHPTILLWVLFQYTR